MSVASPLARHHHAPDDAVLPLIASASREKDRDVREWNRMAAQQALAALFYAVTSLLVIFVNKIVLTGYKFSSYSFLALAQFLATAVVMKSLQMFGKVKVRPAM